ncbi:MAG: glycosyltransferase [Methanogenium sp.]
MIAKDLSSVSYIRDAGIPFNLFQAPEKKWKSEDFANKQISYSSIIQNASVKDFDSCLSLVEGWRSIFLSVCPHLVIVESSPTALMALKTIPNKIRTIITGTGFSIPPNRNPFPNLKPWIAQQTDFRKLEEDLLFIINKIMKYYRVHKLTKMSNLYDADFTILKTLPELDPYPNRNNPFYYGSWPSNEGENFEYKKGSRIFVYLNKKFLHQNTLMLLLEALSTIKGINSVVYIEDLPNELKKKYSHPSIQYFDRPINISKALGETHLAITHAGLNTTINFLLNGTPVLMIPEYLEQFITAKLVDKMGCGMIMSSIHFPIKSNINIMITLHKYRRNTMNFSEKYSGFFQEPLDRIIINKIHDLLG